MFSSSNNSNVMADLFEDRSFLLELTSSYMKRLTDFMEILERIDLNKDSINKIVPTLTTFIEQFTELMREIEATNLNNVDQSSKQIINSHYIFYERLRTLVGVMSGAVTSLEWQSPSFFSSTFAQAGRDAGKIKQAFNDYKRDQHSDAKTYEKKFLKEYIDAPIKIPFFVYATSSGMAALTTICGFLLGELPSTTTILVGKSCYFEEKFILNSFFKGRTVEIDEQNSEEMINYITQHRPGAIFLDSLCNSASITFPDLVALIAQLKKLVTWKTYLIIDNTGRSVTFQPFALSLRFNPHLHIVCWESLLKHHQMGLDRVNAGIIYSRANTAGKLYMYRDHLGTNISDIATQSLPTPNRRLLENRLLRHERNALILVEELSKKITPSSNILGVISPLSSAHPSYNNHQSLPFHGAFLSLEFRIPTRKNYLNYLHRAFSLAKKRQVPLIGGSSFGLPITRLYIPAFLPGQGIPFVRIAVGTEPISAFIRVTEVLVDALQS